MDNKKYIVYGREFSVQTVRALEYLKAEGLEHDFYDIDFDEEAMYFIKHNKIIGLPVIKLDKRFIVGWNDRAPELLSKL